jgi:hypothetical protein
MATLKRSGIVFTSVDSAALKRALAQMPKEVLKEVRQKNMADARDLKDNLQGAPQSTPQQKLVQKAIYAKQDRFIRLELGGKKRVGRQYMRRKQIKTAWGVAKSSEKMPWRAPAGALVYGSEYGSSGKPKDRAGRDMGNRYVLPHRKQGYWIAPTVRKYVPDLIAKYERRIAHFARRKGF